MSQTAFDEARQDITSATPAETRLCRSCGAALRHMFVDLGMSPLANSNLEAAQLNQMEPFYPLRAYVCHECFLVQLVDVATPARIFNSEYPYLSSYSASWVQHAKAYAEMIVRRLALDSRSRVVEIASNDGYLLQFFAGAGIPALGIEPAANVAKVAIGRGLPTLIKFFGSETARELVANHGPADLIVANNVLAHVPRLNDFIAGLRLLLAATGTITAEFPHLMRLIDEHEFDTIYHEHFSYFSLLAVRAAFARNGLKIFDVEELPTHGGSLRIYAAHGGDGSKAIAPAVASLLRREAARGLARLGTYFSFAPKVLATKRALLDFVFNAKETGNSIVAYGAPAKGNTLLNYCGIRADIIDYAVDRSPSKQGRFLPGTHIAIHHPDQIRETRPDYLLLLPWNLREEIMDQMAHVRDWGCRFVTPIPDVRIYP